MENISYYIIIIFIFIILAYGFLKKVNVYDTFIDGMKFQMKEGIWIFPYLLLMLVAVNVFKASGILNDLIHLNFVPSELLIQGIFRPASSHASLSMMLQSYEIYGVDSKEGITASILQGGSDTTIYVMGLYFGSVGIKKTRHAYIVGLICDLICLICCIVLYIFIL